MIIKNVDEYKSIIGEIFICKNRIENTNKSFEKEINKSDIAISKTICETDLIDEDEGMIIIADTLLKFLESEGLKIDKKIIKLKYDKEDEGEKLKNKLISLMEACSSLQDSEKLIRFTGLKKRFERNNFDEKFWKNLIKKYDIPYVIYNMECENCGYMNEQWREKCFCCYHKKLKKKNIFSINPVVENGRN